VRRERKNNPNHRGNQEPQERGGNEAAVPLQRGPTRKIGRQTEDAAEVAVEAKVLQDGMVRRLIEESETGTLIVEIVENVETFGKRPLTCETVRRSSCETRVPSKALRRVQSPQ